MQALWSKIISALSQSTVRRILHRDLKSKNIFLKNNLLKIGDFGVSRLLMGSCDLATTLTGTPHYMSPEALKHQGYNTKSDIWSLACILYEMCCMNHAFTGSNFLSIVLKIVEGDTPSLPKRYPRELNAIMECMLNKSPSLRPSAMEILKIPYIDEQLQHLMCRYSEITLEDKNLNCQKEAAQIINAMQKKIHLQTLRALSEVQKMTPRERMRLRKLQAADEKAQKLKKLAEEKYEENNKRMQELRSRNSEQLTVDILHEFDDLTSENLPESQPIPSLDLDPLESSIEDHGMTDLGDHVFIDSNLMAPPRSTHSTEACHSTAAESQWASPSFLKAWSEDCITSILRTCQKCRISDPTLGLLAQQLQNPSDMSVHSSLKRLSWTLSSTRTGTMSVWLILFPPADTVTGSELVLEIPEDPLVAEEYYTDTFDSCSEDSEEEEEEIVFSAPGEEVKDEGSRPAYRTLQQMQKLRPRKSSHLDQASTLSGGASGACQDSDIEALVGCLENVLGCTSLDTRTVTSTASDMSPGPTVFTSTVARSKMKHMKESAMQKLGAEVFEKVYNYLKRARRQKANEAEIRVALEKVVPRAGDCFEVDQLLYFEEQLLITVGKGPMLQNPHQQLSKTSKSKGTNPFNT
uniref:serine/threonine-protein kinase Nek11 isoform X1 n=1 Tax=Halichoerus grypus TaxID=9711 RepID=UPI001658DABC|nr:serine/threonine-protein kinase Nek11 isoform X1 [Halichoerus grypus]